MRHNRIISCILTGAVPIMAGQAWNPNDPSYKCCCKCCHVRTGAKIIAFIECIDILILVGVAVAAYLSSKTQSKIEFGIAQGVAILGAVTLILLFVGLCKHSGICLIPFMIYLVIFVIGAITIVIKQILFLVAWENITDSEGEEKIIEETIDQPKEVSKKFVTVFMSLLICFWIILAGVHIWFLTVYIKCYKYFEDASTLGMRGQR